MRLLSRTIKKLRPDIYESVQKEALFVLNQEAGASSTALKEDIFRLLESRADLLQFPIEDDELCGFICDYKGGKFVFINTYLPLEKQLFAAGHELYHLRNNNLRELLSREALDEEEEVDLDESKANLFAALVLVPEESLRKELALLGVKTAQELNLLKIIRLMDTFGAPYKAVIIRLFELEILDEEQAKSWLEVPDRNPNEGVLYAIKKHQIGERWQERTKKVKYSNLKSLILDNDQAELLPKKRIDKDLSFLDVKVDE